ncbi:hypothetical protein CTI12_AA501290 [Artemisia annua]|uniref:Uncharacterized protein n=1 Tax=Artemisia annua TaxID=35608 RepID=A0A2U1LDX6_ARTAN|nr:hypothetical protein CTI12_AA501290 [Artemisia annua]
MSNGVSGGGGGSPYRRHKNDVESSGGGDLEEDYDLVNDPFDIVRTKNTSVERLKRWSHGG